MPVTELTSQSVYSEILQRQPVRFASLLPSQSRKCRRLLGSVLQPLFREKLIRRVRIDEEVYLVSMDWAPSAEMVRLQIDGRSRYGQDGCIDWLDGLHATGPRISIQRNGTTRPVLVRRWLWNAAGLRGRGKSPALRPQDVIEMVCGNEACIALEHMRLRDRSDALKGRPRPLAVRIRMSERNGNRKLSPEDAEKIRCSDEPGKTLAHRYGVTQAAISAIRLCKVQAPLRGMFTQLIR